MIKKKRKRINLKTIHIKKVNIKIKIIILMMKINKYFKGFKKMLKSNLKLNLIRKSSNNLRIKQKNSHNLISKARVNLMQKHQLKIVNFQIAKKIWEKKCVAGNKHKDSKIIGEISKFTY